MHTTAILLDEPGQVSLASLELDRPGAADVVVDVQYSGISTGTERLLWCGRMPAFPGMGYPLVPGYEAVGTVVEAGPDADLCVGDTAFVPGARCFGDVRALFGASAGTLVAAGARVSRIPASLGANAAALALAATAHHAIKRGGRPDLIVGHGALGQLLARLTALSSGDAPTVWETQPCRRPGARDYQVIDPAHDDRRDYGVIVDASGDASLLDTLLARLARGGNLVLAGFYPGNISFAFAPAFMREARLTIAAEWLPEDMTEVGALVDAGRLSLDGLITHTAPATEAARAYQTAFDDPSCLKLALDWRAKT